MRKIFKNKKILFPAIVSFCLLFFALVGVRYAHAVDPECISGEKTGTCQTVQSCPSLTEEIIPTTKLCPNPATQKCCAAKSPACSGTAAGATDTASGICMDSCTDPNKPITLSLQNSDACPDQVCCYIPPTDGKQPSCAAAGGVCKANLCVAPEQDVTNQVAPETNCATVDPNTPYCCVAAPATTPDATPSTQNPAPTPPDEAGWIAGAINYFIDIGIYLLGKLLVAVFELIVKVSQFNDIVNSYFVVTGWIVLRDLVNMFFVLGLLFIAFVTVLKIERYQWQKLLPKLLLMAVVVNFSRTICGLMIDFFQVIMFTFVNAYKDIVAGNLWKALGFNDMWDQGSSTGDVGDLALIAGRLLGLIYIIVALIVSLIFLIILVFRIIMLWVLVVFSPLAFFSAAFNGISGKIGSYWGQWFKQFIEYCMVGPLLAFFLWLSILSMGSDYNTMYAQRMSPGVDSSGQQQMTTTNKAGRLDYIMKYVLGILMLVAGLKFTADTKVMGSSLAGKAASKIQDATAGRMERWAGGAYDLGKKYTGMTAKETLGRVERSGGVSGRLAKWARLVGTKEGRQTLGERTEARILAHAGGQNVALQEQRQKEQDRYAKQYKLAGVADNPEMMKKELARASGDRKQALMDILGDEGKMTSEIYNDAVKNGDFEHLGVKTKKNKDTGEIEIDFEKSSSGALAALEKKSKKWEKAYQARTHLPIAFSPFTRNEVTNAWEPTGAGSEGKKKKLKDVEDALAKENSANLGLAINNGDFANTGDLATDLAHLAAVGRNSNFKTVGEDAQKKVAKLIQEKLAALQGDNSGAAQHFDLDRMKNVQKAHEVGTGQWEPGSGRGTIGYSNSDLATSISALRKRPEHDAAKAADPALMAMTDRQMPNLLKQFQSLPIAKQNDAIRQHMSTVSGKDASAVLTDKFLDETRKFSSDIIDEGKARDDLGGSVTSALRHAIALSRKKDGGSQNELNQVIAGLLSTQSVGQHKIDSEGMSGDVFQLGQFSDWADQVKGMIGANAERQREIILGIATNAQAAGYFNGDLPKFKDNEAGGGTGGGAGGGGTGGGGTGGGETGGRVVVEPVSSGPSSTTVNIVSNITQNLTNKSGEVLSSANDSLSLKEAIKQTLKPMLDSSVATLQEKFGDQFTAADKAKLYQRFDAVEAAAAAGGDMKSVRNKVESEMNKLTDEIDSLKTTFKS